MKKISKNTFRSKDGFCFLCVGIYLGLRDFIINLKKSTNRAWQVLLITTSYRVSGVRAQGCGFLEALVNNKP